MGGTLGPVGGYGVAWGGADVSDCGRMCVWADMCLGGRVFGWMFVWADVCLGGCWPMGGNRAVMSAHHILPDAYMYSITFQTPRKPVISA